MTHGKTYNKSQRRINHKATTSKTNYYNKQRWVLMANSIVCQSKWKPIVEPRRAKLKTYRQAPTHWLKFYEEAVTGSEKHFYGQPTSPWVPMQLLIQKSIKIWFAYRLPTQSMHQSENIKKSNSSQRWVHSRLILLWDIVNENSNSWSTVGQAKDKSSSLNLLVKVLRRGRHWVWSLNRRRAIKEWWIAVNNDGVDN